MVELTQLEKIHVAWEMRKHGYGYEAIAEYLGISVYYARRLVDKGINHEHNGTWPKRDKQIKVTD